MIVQLKEGQIDTNLMTMPELLKSLFIQYTYEKDTDHLLPRLTINGHVYEGDHVYINTELVCPRGTPLDKDVKMQVELLDARGVVVKSYTGTIPYYEYCIIGKKPLRPDVEAYVRKLEQHIEDLTAINHTLQDRVTYLEEKGDLI